MDYYELDNNEKIYPIIKIEIDGKNYLFYSKKEKETTTADIIVVEENNDELIPVEEELLPTLEAKYQEVIIYF